MNYKKLISPTNSIYFLLFATYLYTLASVPIPYADSAELITTGYTFSVSHPPGYPIFNSLIWLITHVPVPVNIATRAHLLAAILHTATVILLIKTMISCIRAAYPQISKHRAHVYSLTSGLIIAFSTQFWINSIIIEVFALNHLFAALLLYFATKISFSVQTNSRLNRMLAIVMGASLAHHHTIILILPSIILLISPKLMQWRRQDYVIFLALIVSSFVASYTLLYLAWNRQSPDSFSWAFHPDLSGWIRYIFRLDYTGNIIEDSTSIHAYFKPIDITQNLKTLWHYLTYLIPQNLTWPVYLLILYGWTSIYQISNKQLRRILLTLILIPGPLFAAYVIAPTFETDSFPYYFYRTYSERMYNLGYLILPISLPFAFYKIEKTYKKYTTSINQTKKYLLLSCLPIIVLFSSISKVTSATTPIPYQIAKTSIESLDPHSILVCFSDISCFLNAYILKVEQIRPDITLVPITPQFNYNQLSLIPDIQRFSYADNPYRILDIISWNLYKGRSVYVTEVPEFYISLLGLDGTALYLQPGIYAHQISCQSPIVSDELLPPQIDAKIPLIKHYSELLFDDHIINATIAAHGGYKEFAAEELQAAGQIAPNNSAVTSRLQALPNYAGNTKFLRGEKCPTASDLIEEAQTCDMQNNPVCTYHRYLQATLLEPENIQARLLLATHYFQNGQLQLAKREYQNVLTLDPESPTAINQLQTLSNLPDLPPLPWQ